MRMTIKQIMTLMKIRVSREFCSFLDGTGTGKIWSWKKYWCRKNLVPKKVQVSVPEKFGTGTGEFPGTFHFLGGTSIVTRKTGPGKMYRRCRYQNKFSWKKGTGTSTRKIWSRKKEPVLDKLWVSSHSAMSPCYWSPSPCWTWSSARHCPQALTHSTCTAALPLKSLSTLHTKINKEHFTQHVLLRFPRVSMFGAKHWMPKLVISACRTVQC